MRTRRAHERAVRLFLSNHIGAGTWSLSLPRGSGHETYLAQSAALSCFVKVNAASEITVAVAELGVAPPVLASGRLADGAPIVVQAFIDGRRPSPHDLQTHLDSAAGIVHALHHATSVRQYLPPAASEEYRTMGLRALEHVRERWRTYAALVSAASADVDAGLDILEREIEQFTGFGLVASHNDINNGNWLLTTEGRLYLVDVEAMSLEDPACDLGALLWWYYPPELRSRFLAIANPEHDTELAGRMRARMALHCLGIALPRDNSFDVVDAAWFASCLEDFRAVLAGRENPKGYGASAWTV